jgi:hypothetical protein
MENDHEFDPMSEEFSWCTLKVCSACKESGKEDYEEACEGLWDSLPNIFGLPNQPRCRYFSLFYDVSHRPCFTKLDCLHSAPLLRFSINWSCFIFHFED